MKKIFNIVVLTVCVLLTACSNDDDNDNNDTGLKVISVKNLSFEALGEGTGTITMSEQDISASSSEEWCSVTVQGNIVNVTASLNKEATSRNASVKIKNASGEQVVAINQRGLYVGLISTNEIGADRLYLQGGEKKVLISTNAYSYEVEFGDIDWIRVPEGGYNGDTITFDYDQVENYPLRTMHPREGSIVIILKDKNNQEITRKEISFSQDIPTYEDLLGNWRLSYNDGDNRLRTVMVVLEQKEVSKSYTLKGFPILPGGTTFANLTTSYSFGNLTISAGQYLGAFDFNIGTLHTTLFVTNRTYGAQSAEKSNQIEAVVDANVTYFSLKFQDNGSWLYPAEGLLIGASTDPEITDPNDDAYRGYTNVLTNILIRKM